MLQLSLELFIFATLFVHNRQRHRGERLSFDPLENLENSCVRAISLNAASPAVAYILLSLLKGQLTYIPAGVS